MSKAKRFKKLDHELSWPNNAYPIERSATSPITYPLAPGSLNKIEERQAWIRAQAVLTASQYISPFELGMLAKFEMLKWLGCGYPEDGYRIDLDDDEVD